ncbi:Uncharacterised protein [Cronobacter sakazakii]|nr:Uncharacterised protein [Cronobacter sakazakii]
MTRDAISESPLKIIAYKRSNLTPSFINKKNNI